MRNALVHFLFFGLVLCTSVARAHDPKGVACPNVEKVPAIVTPNLALEKNPDSLDTRFQLAAALIDQRCYDAAVHVLEAGESIHPRNVELQAKLRHARSLISEQQYFEGLDRAEAAAKLSRNLLRCNKLADLNACDEALVLKPDDPEIITAKADALVQVKRPAEALAVYRRALDISPSKDAINAKLAAAEAQRQASASMCQSSSGDAALQACKAALLRGATDEFAIHKRSGILLQESSQPAAALESYLAASALERDDRSVALAIVALSDSTGRKDAVTLAARGSALMTLGRAREAVVSLRQAQSLAPSVADIRAQLAAAERIAKTEATSPTQQAATTATSRPERVAAAGSAVQVPPLPVRQYSNNAEPSRSH